MEQQQIITDHPHIRRATPADASSVAPLLVAAMESFACTFAGSDNPQDALHIFERFAAMPGNQYSYTNTLVYADGAHIAGIVTGYDGALLEKLRAPFFEYLTQHYAFDSTTFGAETTAGEYYLDTVSVLPERRGEGIGKALIRAACAVARQEGHKQAGLLVDAENPRAKKLYTELGFLGINTHRLAGGEYEHMVMPL